MREAQPKQLVECVTHICDRGGREFDEPRRARVNRQMNDVRQQWLDKFRNEQEKRRPDGSIECIRLTVSGNGLHAMDTTKL